VAEILIDKSWVQGARAAELPGMSRVEFLLSLGLYSSLTWNGTMPEAISHE
jgi:hypothetical protein